MKVALLGLPGAGKTSLGRRLSSLLSIPCIDVDDDILEPTWGCTVAEKLAKVGDQKFLLAEEEALLQVGFSKTLLLFFRQAYLKRMGYWRAREATA